MSDTAARPWWADVQHLRPDAGDAAFAPADPSVPAGPRFPRRERRDAPEAEARTSRFARDRDRDREHPTDEPAARADVARELAALAAQPSRARAAATPADQPRRTIEIRGTVERIDPTPSSDEVAQLATRSRSIRSRGGRRSPEQLAGPRPDRIALWALVLGLVLALAAVLSNSEAHAAAAALTPLLGTLGAE